MIADQSRGKGPEPGKAQMGSASPNTPAASDEVDSQGDERFKQALADLSRVLGERTAQQSAADPGTKTGPETGKARPGGANPDMRPNREEVDSLGDEIVKQFGGLSHQVGERPAQRAAGDPPAGAEARRAALRKAAPDTAAAKLRDVKRVSGTVKTALAAMVTTAAPPGAPTDIRRARRRKIAPIAASLIAGAVAGWWLYRSEAANHIEMTIPAATRTGDDVAEVNQVPQRQRAEAPTREPTLAQRELEIRALLSRKAGDEAGQTQQAAERSPVELQQAAQQERDKAETLTRDLAAARREIETQTAMARAAGSEAAQAKEAAERAAAELRQALQQAEASATAYQQALAQERARTQELEQQLAARRDATASLSDTPGPTHASAPDEPTTAAVPASDKPVIAAVPVNDEPATVAVRLTVPEATGNPEVPRLMERASLLLSQGDIGAARIVLDRAAETGNAQALFALAETYDPFILSAWGTFGTQGDAAKARELYAKAFSGGVQEAKDRLNALR